jgi:hypothetical protein
MAMGVIGTFTAVRPKDSACRWSMPSLCQW